MNTKRKLKRKVAMVVAGVVAVAAAGTAYALWSATGSGPGRAQALTAQSITVTAATGAADLFPGFSDGDVHFTLTNPNPYPVTFTSMTAGTITSSNQAACAASLLTVDPASGLALAVGAGQTTGNQSIADVVTLDATAPDGCQGVSFTIQLTLSGTQS
jgi:hypothetical protein